MTTFVNDTAPRATEGRGGTSPIGTTSPNTGARANTNSSYSQGAFASGLNYQGTATAYTLQDTDYQGIIVFNTTSAVTVTLNSALQPRGSGNNFTCFIVNINTGALTLTPSATPAVYPVNGVSSLSLTSGVGANVFFANRQWWAFTGATYIPTPGVLSFAFVQVSSNYNILTTDFTVECITNAFTVTLPTAVGVAGKAYNIKNDGPGTITVATTSSQTIDGSLTQLLSPYDCLWVESNGANWMVV